MADSSARSGKLHAGTISGAYGIKGWVRVLALTDPLENFLAFPAWYVKGKGKGSGKAQHGAPVFDSLRFEDGRRHGKGLIAKIEGVDDRTAAEQLRGTKVWVDGEDLAPLDDGDYYWHQLEGLAVWSYPQDQDVASDKASEPASEQASRERHGEEGPGADAGAAGQDDPERAEGPAPLLLGVVDHLLETGANDVLVVAPCEGSIDQRERLIPYLPGDVVRRVDMQAGRIDVQWHPDD